MCYQNNKNGMFCLVLTYCMSQMQKKRIPWVHNEYTTGWVDMYSISYTVDSPPPPGVLWHSAVVEFSTVRV